MVIDDRVPNRESARQRFCSPVTCEIILPENEGTMATNTWGQAGTHSAVAHHMVTTAFELDGYRIVRNLGVVRGITVRSRSVLGTIGASLQTLVGGNITLLTKLCEKTREESFNLMLEHAAQLGAN